MSCNVYCLAASGLSCGMQDLLSLADPWGTDSMAAAHSLNSCRVVVQALSCSLACGVLVPWPGIESPALRGGFLTTGPPGEPQDFLFHLIFKMLVVTPYINVLVFWLLVSSRLKHSASPFVKAFPVFSVLTAVPWSTCDFFLSSQMRRLGDV